MTDIKGCKLMNFDPENVSGIYSRIAVFSVPSDLLILADTGHSCDESSFSAIIISPHTVNLTQVD